MKTLNDTIYDEFDSNELEVILRAALTTLRNEIIMPKFAMSCDAEEEELEELAAQISAILNT